MSYDPRMAPYLNDARVRRWGHILIFSAMFYVAIVVIAKLVSKNKQQPPITPPIPPTK